MQFPFFGMIPLCFKNYMESNIYLNFSKTYFFVRNFSFRDALLAFNLGYYLVDL